jgi:type I restriction enzyme M protein
MKYREVSLNDTECFQLAIGTRVLKKNLASIAGDIPLYSANVFEPFGHICYSNIVTFNHPVILWGIDGNFDLNYIKPNILFATTDHCGAITILQSDIIPQYVLYCLYILKEELAFDRNFRASLSNMRRISQK